MRLTTKGKKEPSLAFGGQAVMEGVRYTRESRASIFPQTPLLVMMKKKALTLKKSQ